MKTIKKISDILNLQQSGSLDDSYLEYLKNYLTLLHESLGNRVSIEHFSLEEHGYLVILEKDDDVRNLKEMDLNPDQSGLLDCWPEFVEVETLNNGTQLYKICVLYDNDYMMFLYSLVGQFDDEVENWLKEQSQYNY